MALRFDPEVLATDPGPRRRVLDVLDAALVAVDPAAAVRRHLRRGNGELWVGDQAIPEPAGTVVLLALGKAASAMASAAVVLLRGLAVTGVVATTEGAEVPGLEVIAAGHPLPNHESLRAGRLMLSAAASAGPEDLVLVLISGGGSALAEVPPPGVSLGDLRVTGEALLGAGAPIAEVNTVRRHLSMLKGGRLGALAAPGRLVSLVVSDVVGNALEVVAGGPTVADPTSPADAVRVLADRGIEVPAGVVARLQSVDGPPRSVPGHVVVVADGAMAARAAAHAATSFGVTARVGATAIEGDARRAGEQLASAARALASETMSVHHGETTVRVVGGGVGGRNHEVALSAGVALEGTPGALVASLGTDGVDGPSGAAGGFGDEGTIRRGRDRGLDARAALDANDSARYLRSTADQLRCGPTGTNVGDLMIAYRFAADG